MQTGRFRTGLGQALVIWLAAVAAIWLVRNVTVAWSVAVAALFAALLLGNLHKRRARADSAAGVYTGSLLWPLLFGVTVIGINIATMSMSPYE